MSDVPWDFGDAEMSEKGKSPPSLSITVINDPVHGHMEFHPLVMKVVNTPQFQRLRNLKQLGCCYMVYPGGAHNRFEHCMGVSYLAMKVASTLEMRQPELGITNQDILCVAIAGLCHDVGHGPFSHTFEEALKEFHCELHPNQQEWKHEQASEKMFEYMWTKNNLKDAFDLYGMDETHKDIILRLISGNPGEDEKEAKGFLYQIVANNKNGIDVDKWDYLARDALNTGMPNCFDHRRLMKFVRAIEHKGAWVLCTRDKEVSNVYEMFKHRHFMYERVYNHKVVKCVEEMIKDALQAAVDSKAVVYPGEGEVIKDIFECTKDMAAYTLLDDSVLNRILTTSSADLEGEQKESLEKAKEILQRINERDLYRCVAETSPVTTKMTHGGEKMTNGGEKMTNGGEMNTDGGEMKTDGGEMKTDGGEMKTDGGEMKTDGGEMKSIEEFKRDGFVVMKSPLSYEKAQSNPVDKMLFYSKHEPDVAKPISKEEVSLFLPTVFAERTFRLICKKRAAEMSNACKDAIEAFEAECKKIKLNDGGELKVKRYVKQTMQGNQ